MYMIIRFHDMFKSKNKLFYSKILESSIFEVFFKAVTNIAITTNVKLNLKQCLVSLRWRMSNVQGILFSIRNNKYVCSLI